MRRLQPLILLPLLAGCFGSAPPVPKEQYFRLMAAQPAEEASRQISGGIEVVPFAGEGVMSERPLLFSADGGPKKSRRPSLGSPGPSARTSLSRRSAVALPPYPREAA